ncbi:hypothetical protein SAMN05446589_9192 [Streptomyces sp. OV198]|jgi:hypothetical protein|nr:hypothetical protein SAMN05446589_9192 [Streptomyces sp. OV198]
MTRKGPRNARQRYAAPLSNALLALVAGSGGSVLFVAEGRHYPTNVVVSADGRGVVSHAGSRLLADLADATGRQRS